jgi:hypothetical protein
MTTATIPKSVTSIGCGAFGWCSNLKKIVVDPENDFYADVNGVLFEKDRIRLIQFPSGVGGNYLIPDSVSYIESYAFRGNSNLTSVTIPDRCIFIL